MWLHPDGSSAMTPRHQAPRTRATDPFWGRPSGSTGRATRARFPRAYTWVRPRPVLTTLRQRFLVDGFLAAVIMGLLLSIYNPALLVAGTTATGGDTGAHVYAAWYAREHLLPNGLISGWSPGWLAGVPMFHYYFPLAAIVIGALSYVIPFEVAFKLVTAIGPFLFPLATYILFRLLRFDFPAPIIAALLATAFLFMDSFTIYGANLASTLAGEFAFSIAFATSLIFVGLLYRLVTDDGGRPLLAALVLTITTLTHLVPVMMIVLAGPAYVYWGIKELGWQVALRRLGVVFGIAGGLTALWSIPFLARLSWTTSFGTTPLSGLGIVFPKQLWIYVVGTMLACALGWLRRDRRVLVLLLPGLVGLSLYFLGITGLIWNGRWLPFWYVSAFLCSAYLLGSAIPLIARAVSRRWTAIGALALTVVVGLAASGWILWKRNGSFVRHWASHNYSGYERTTGWPTFEALHEVLNDLPPGRVIAEDADIVAEFGTTFAFMSLPYWTDQSTVEGLFFESSITTPFLIMLQAELSEQPSYSIPYLPYQDFDLERAALHMRALDTSYLIAASQLTKDAALVSGEFDEVAVRGSYSVFELDPPQPVVVPDFEPVVVPESAWDVARIDWWTGINEDSIPVATDGPAEWERVSAYRGAIPRSALSHGGESIDADVRNDEITFSTDAIGEPHIVRVSHFPNWRVEGAEGPYQIAPSFMVVVPTQSEVRLSYERTWAEWFGLCLTLLTIAALAVPTTRRRMLMVWGGAPNGRGKKRPR